VEGRDPGAATPTAGADDAPPLEDKSKKTYGRTPDGTGKSRFIFPPRFAKCINAHPPCLSVRSAHHS
jgi:hypothetical protein